MEDFFRTIGDSVCEEIQKDEKALSVGYHLKKVCEDGGFAISKKDKKAPCNICEIRKNHSWDNYCGKCGSPLIR